MKKWVCSGCGHTADTAPGVCPECKADGSKFKEHNVAGGFVTEHVIGLAKDAAGTDLIKDLQAHFNGECCEVGMYLAMARAAYREGYAEIGMYFEKAAWEEAEHAAKFAELLGEVLTDSTKENLKKRAEAEHGACTSKFEIAKRAKDANLEAIHDKVHQMAKDEARHCAAFRGLYDRYFK